jgi:hypothetical protein
MGTEAKSGWHGQSCMNHLPSKLFPDDGWSDHAIDVIDGPGMGASCDLKRQGIHTHCPMYQTWKGGFRSQSTVLCCLLCQTPGSL